MSTRKRHTPEQVVRKLTEADRLLSEGKDVAEVHDYHDRAVPMVAASLARRMPGYGALGFVQM